MNTVDKIRRNALALSPSERASIAHDLLVSLDEPSGLVLDDKYETEIRRRFAWVRTGRADGEPAETVFTELAGKLRCRR
ncbi:MAG: hypothetical protein A3K19_13805 [Lentisphaerae bacterium RIFOXYB12_FULL_65_16]|nr:MAG: hypothetical protein A3K18_00110 [Lentisphaerae bacterium RIFOXYA12_64_32]OGV84222.1 MAG: hypothetical protein A3K19_13805 [Lentisphaerae bacterium RIFOXYB12_FULL_65_16]